ncbi:MAG: hypothetical protein CHACPFDD_03431 [Phycisphaerae bacterium]|nr:hypothetical protein [Phycisphaerae bacterium]
MIQIAEVPRRLVETARRSVQPLTDHRQPHTDPRGNTVRLLSTLLSMATAALAAAQTPPATPTITEPAADGQIVNGEDVHMETAPFFDADGDGHLCTDWEIWTITPAERVWVTSCIGGVERLHTHLGDGVFENSHAGRSSLVPQTDFRLRVRHRDDSGHPPSEWSAWAQRLFTTGAASTVFPLEIDDVASTPPPALRDTFGLTLELPGGADPAWVKLASSAFELLAEIRGVDGGPDQVTNPPALAAHSPVRVAFYAGGAAAVFPDMDLSFTDGAGRDVTIYLPAMSLAPQAVMHFWVSQSGSTYYGLASQTEPDFSSLARGAPVPWAVPQPGYKVEVFATGFQLPVNIAFVPNPGPDPDDPLFYVSELYGTIRVVLRDGHVQTYADNLLNFNPTGEFPGSGEQGLTGIVVDPATGNLYAAMLYDAAPPNGPHYPKVDRFTSTDGGLTAATRTTILNMAGETQGQSHQISNLTIGPDGKLYVHMGDGFDASKAQDLDSFRGKVLRLNLNGTAASDNPFYNASNGITARDYVFAYGFRNPFGGAWRTLDGRHYEVENGPSIDRFAQVITGRNYLWDGSDPSMQNFAIYNWIPAHAPVNIAFIQPATFNGSLFPAAKQDHAFVSESGATWATGPGNKRVVEFVLDAAGNLVSGPTTLVEYNGSGKATCAALAAGPDGLYFSDLYKDLGYSSPIDVGANILRIKYVGTADFVASATVSCRLPFSVQFTDQSTVPGASAWLWDFGDGGSSTEKDPLYVYNSAGTFNVRLSVTGTNGVSIAQKNAYIIAGDFNGVRGEYYNNIDLTNLGLVRFDPQINFDWGTGSPDPSIGADTFSCRWTGRVRPLYSETYTFWTRSDDGIRLWVNEQLVIDNWTDHAPQFDSGTIALQAGRKYDLRMEQYENGGLAVAELYWESPSQTIEFVPAAALFPPGLCHERGDLNCDGSVNGFDIEPFTLALSDPDGYFAAYPDCDYDLADVDENGSINGFDVDPFVDRLLGGG